MLKETGKGKFSLFLCSRYRAS